MSGQAGVSQPSGKGVTGILVGFSIIGVLLVLAFSILAGYSVGKDLQSRQVGVSNAVTRH